MERKTISQALRRIAKLKGEYKETLDRAAASVTYQESDPPAFAFNAMLERANAIRVELIGLESQLRVTNARTVIKVGEREMPLAQATAELQEHKARIVWLKSLTVQNSKKLNKLTRVVMNGQYADIPVLTVCDCPEMMRTEMICTEQEAFDALNDAVETINHKTLLV